MGVQCYPHDSSRGAICIEWLTLFKDHNARSDHSGNSLWDIREALACSQQSTVPGGHKGFNNRQLLNNQPYFFLPIRRRRCARFASSAVIGAGTLLA
jgi:hypothetical protein